MTKKNKKIILITSMITILPILAGLILWNKLPEQVATHFDFNGIPNGYSSRAFAVFGPYLICLCVSSALCIWNTGRSEKTGDRAEDVRTDFMDLSGSFPVLCSCNLW